MMAASIAGLPCPAVNAPMVALRDTVTSTFSEAEKEAELELKAFDKLCDQLKADAVKQYRERVAGVLSSAIPVQEA